MHSLMSGKGLQTFLLLLGQNQVWKLISKCLDLGLLLTLQQQPTNTEHPKQLHKRTEPGLRMGLSGGGVGGRENGKMEAGDGKRGIKEQKDHEQ